jgi:hypothetical protein
MFSNDKPYPLDSKAAKFDPPRETATVVKREARVLAPEDTEVS